MTMTENMKCAAAIVFVLLVFGLAGNDDYAQEVAEEAAACKRNPTLSYCK